MDSQNLSEALWARLSRSSSKAPAQPGLVLLMVRHAKGIQRVTVCLGPDGVQIEQGTRFPTRGEPWAVVQTDLADWESFVAQPDESSAGRFQIYGDTSVLQVLGRRMDPTEMLWAEG